MDATQMMCDSLLESDEEEEDANARAEPLATLRVFKNKHIPETVLPLYLGENVLGRDPSACTLPLHAQSVSKQHTAVSISVFHGSSQRGCASIEALVWDMGSMNGTRKGRLKLTPHVRYALSEGDNLMVADIPCQYTICTDTGGLVNIVSLVARESEGTREDVEVHANGNEGEPTRASLGERGERMETPARTKGLSFEQTPTQPEGSLVPESDSDGEQGGKDRRRKALVSVSESNSHVASPSCSTFLSPTNKIIPESEDESPITPSSSSKHRPTRCVSADSDEPDVGAWQQQLKDKKAALFIAADSEEGQRAAPVVTEPEERGGRAPDNPVNSVSTGATEELGQPGPVHSAELIQVLNMDSDTDVEGEEESAVSAGPVTPNRTLPAPAPPPPPATAPTSQWGHFNMDSDDTDVDDEYPTPGEVLAARQTDGDTGVDADGGVEPDGATEAPRASPQREDTPPPCAGPAQPSDFHPESDTDVEEDGDECRVASAAPQNFDLGSDTDDEVLPADANGDPASEGVHAPLASTVDARAHLDILSDSDTDAEEDSPPIPPAVAVATHNAPISSAPPSSSGSISLAAALGPDSDADTDVDETSASPAGAGMNGDFRMDSDTDKEDEEEAGAVGAEGGQVSCSSDEKDFGSIQGPRASLQQCSTPVVSSGGAVAEMETQEYHSPSIDPFKCPRVPAPRLAVSPSSSGSLGEDDFVVAETQSFIVDDREQQTSPLGNFTLDETQPFAPQGTSKQGDDEDGTTTETSFQLSLSESIHLQLQQAQALATESTQAFVLSDGDVNLEATQAYSISPSVEGSSLEPDSHLEATQSYQGAAGSSRPSAVSQIKPQVDILLEGTQAYIVEAGTTCALSSAETQPMAASPVEESDDEDSAPVHRKRKARRLVEEDSQSVTGLETAAAETQPRSSTSSDESQEEGDKRPSLRGMRSRRQRNLEGATSTRATVAATKPVLGPKGRPRGGRGREPRPGTSRGCKKEEEEEEEEKKEQEHPAAVGSTRSKRKTRASTRGGAGVVGPEEETGQVEETEGDQVMPGARRKTRENARERKERLEREAETERIRKEQEERERLERERLEMEEKERKERERKEREEKERLERTQREKEEQGRLLREKKEREERERLETEEKERLERERQKREEEERLQKEEQEHLERERKERRGDECEVASAAPRNFDLGSDTDDEVLPADASGDPASEGVHALLAPAVDPRAHLDILSDSDTDAEEDSPPIPPAIAMATHNAPISSAPPSSSGPISLAAALGPDSDADTDVDETSASPAGAGMNGDFRMDSDTDKEDEEEAGAVGAEGGQVSCSSDEKDFGSIQGPRASLQQCSTPVASSGGAVAEMETQEYHSPSIDPFKCPRVPAPRLAVSPSSSGSLGEDDFVVAETQSFIVDDREQQTSPLGNFTLDETQPFAPQGTSKQGDDEDGTTTETSFQLSLSESIHLQLQQAQALATESTQAFVLSDGDVNLEATQAYSISPSVEGSSLEPDSHLEATQSYQGAAGSSRPSAVSQIKPQVDILLEGTQAYIVEAGTTCALSSAETQPMAASPVEESDDEDSAPVHRKRKARRLVEEDSQSVTGSETAAAETQPMSSASSDESQEEGDKRPSLRGMRSQRQERNLEGATSTHATVAATKPILGPKGRPRGGRGREPRPGTSRGCKKEEEEEEEEKKEQEHPAAVGSTRSKRKTRASTRGGAGVVGPEEETGQVEETEGDQVMPGARRKTRENARERKERLEREAETERIRKEQEERERLERERLEMEEKERIERERKEREEKERLERTQREKEEQGRLLREKKEREERERLETEEKKRLERERQKREEEERLQKEEQERLDLERKAREERLKKEERERTERQRQELEERARSEREQRKAEQERLEREQKEEEQRAREEEQRAREEQQRLETEREEKETKGTTRGRRATRTAAPPAEPDPEKDCGPATRTRSRSNSSNSVSSERSASSSKARESGGGGRGRGRGAKKSRPPAVAAGKPARDSRRRVTVAGDESRPAGPGPGTRSRSNSNESLNSEASACSGAQSRGRGAGRGRGRGRKSLPAPETNSQPSGSGQNEETAAHKAAARGRKTKRPVSPPGGGEDEPDCGQQPAATRGQRSSNAAHSVPMAVEEQEGTPEDSTLKVTSSPTGRARGPKAQVKCEPVVTAGLAELESGQREEMPTPVKRGRGSMAQVRRNPNEHLVQEEMVKEEEEEEETIERKVKRGRPPGSKKKKKEEETELREEAAAAAASTTHATERDAGPSEVTRTPAGKSSRKRGAATPAKASPVAKSPRAAASPGSRFRAAGQACKVLFTGLVDEKGEKVVVRLGGSLALGVFDMTHLVTDKVRRTVKFLCAMARGIPVVTTQWLEKSAKAGAFLSPHAFIVKDTEQEKKFNFSLQESIRMASIQPLLQGYEIHVTKSVKPEPVHMSDIISCCGASFLAKMPSSHKDRTVVVSCEEDRALCGPAVAACIPVVSAEFLLTGILQQRRDVEAHALPSAPAPTTPTTPAPRAPVARGRPQKRT